MMRNKLALLVMAAGTAVVLSGCFSSNPADINAFTRPEEVVVTNEKYILQPPDEIEIHCSQVPELDLAVQVIRPDGKINLEGIGDIMAAGKTPAELAEDLKEEISSLYTLTGENPVSVRITLLQSNLYYVVGEVAFPGVKVASGRDTALTAIAEAQPTVLAWRSRIQIIRPSSEKNIRPKIFEIDYDRAVAHGDTTRNVLLEEGDIIYVPPTVLATVAMKIEEFIRPIARAFSTVNVIQGPPERR